MTCVRVLKEATSARFKYFALAHFHYGSQCVMTRRQRPPWSITSILMVHGDSAHIPKTQFLFNAKNLSEGHCGNSKRFLVD